MNVGLALVRVSSPSQDLFCFALFVNEQEVVRAGISSARLFLLNLLFDELFLVIMVVFACFPPVLTFSNIFDFLFSLVIYGRRETPP